MLKKLAVVAAVAAAWSAAAVAAPTYITNGGAAGVEATIADSGTFELGAVPGMSWNGVEFVNIDTQSSWYWFASPAPLIADEWTGSNPLGATTFGAGPAAATTVAVGGWSFAQTIIASATNKLSVTLTLTNNTGGTVKGAMWSVGFDPDQGGSGNNSTVNTITGLGNAAAVKAKGAFGANSDYQVTLANDTSAGATLVAAYINSGSCCSPVDPASHFPAQAVGTTTTADDSISLGYKFGDIAAGQSVSIGYSYTFALVPEPETYALMLAGLGVIGWVAKRRKFG